MAQTPKQLPTDLSSDAAGRVKRTIVKPIVYGNIAKYFSRKREEDGHTHQWTVYVKSFNNEDMSTYVKKIHFKLHESYANSNRVLTKPPYEVSETGWGEFEIIIKIYFHDPNEKPVTLYHILKLFQPGITNLSEEEKQRPLVCECYDELLFHEPSTLMEQLLTNSRPLTIGSYSHITDFEVEKQNTLDKISFAKQEIETETGKLRNRLQMAKELIGDLKQKIAKAQEQA